MSRRAQIIHEGVWLGALLAALLLMAGTRARAQATMPPGSHSGAQTSSTSMSTISGNRPQSSRPASAEEAEEKAGFSSDNVTEARIRMRKVYMAEQKKMVKDTYKLEQLAAKLNAEVVKQNGAALTPAELREVAEIEKLARSVRSKMEEPVPIGLFQPQPYFAGTFR
jgi:hypothetical protein